MQNSPAVLVSKLLPLPLTSAGFGQQNLCVFDVDEARFDKSAPAAAAQPGGGFAPCGIFPIDARNRTSRDDCIVAIVPTPEPGQRDDAAATFRVGYVRTATASPNWTNVNMTRSSAFAPGVVGPVRGCDAPHLLELLVDPDYDPATGGADDAPLSPSSGSARSQREAPAACSIVRQWLSPDGRRVALHVDCRPSPEWWERRRSADDPHQQQQLSGEGPQSNGLVSFLLIYDSFVVPDTAGCCGWFLLAVIKLPRGHSIETPVSTPADMRAAAGEDASGVSNEEADGGRPPLPAFPEDPSAAAASSAASAPSYFNSDLGSIIGGFLSTGVFVLGWNEHAINVQLCGDKAGVIVRLYRYRDLDRAQQQQAQAQQPAQPQQRVPLAIPSWMVTSASSISDEEAASIYLMHIHDVRYVVVPLAAAAAMLRGFRSAAAQSQGQPSALQQAAPCMLLHFRVRYNSPAEALVRGPLRHFAIADSVLANTAPPSDKQPSQSGTTGGGGGQAGGATRELAPTTIVALAPAGNGSSAGVGFGAALLRGAAALLGSSSTAAAATAVAGPSIADVPSAIGSGISSSSGAGAAAVVPFAPVPGLSLQTVHRRIERVLSSTACLAAESLLAGQQFQQLEASGAPTCDMGGVGGGGAVEQISVTPGISSSYSLVWERTGLDSHKLWLCVGAKKTSYCVSRADVFGGSAAAAGAGAAAPGVGSAASVLPTPAAPDNGGPVEGGGADGLRSNGGSLLAPASPLPATSATAAPAAAASAAANGSDVLVDLFRAGAQSIVAVGLVDEQKVRMAYVSDWRLNVIEVCFLPNSFFSRKEPPPQLLYSVQLPQALINGGRSIDLNNSTCASVGLLCSVNTCIVVQLPEKLL